MSSNTFIKPVFLISFLILMLVGVAFRPLHSLAQGLFPTFEQCRTQYGGRITLCHATSSSTNPYTRITIACQALYGNGNAGHLDENGTTKAGHEDDVLADENGLCPGQQASPSPSPSSTPTPSPSPTSSPSPSPEGSPTPEPTAEPEGSPSPSPSLIPRPRSENPQEGAHSSLGFNRTCATGNLETTMDLTQNGSAVSNTQVTFIYNGQTQTKQTDAQGRAQAYFPLLNQQKSLQASAIGFPSQETLISAIDSCDSQATAGVGGQSTAIANKIASRNGQILGATTLADTGSGVIANILTTGFMFVSTLSLVEFLYAKTKNSIQK